MSNLYTGFFNNGIVTILLLLIIFASVALLASWIRKILLPESKESLKVDPKKAVKEELDRVLVPLETPLTPKTKSTTSKLVIAKNSPSSPINSTKNKLVKAKKSATVKPKVSSSKNANKRRSKVS